MINLLPEETKKELRAARSNVLLLRYNILSVAAIALLIVFCGVFYLLLTNSKKQAEITQADNATKSAQYNAVREEAEEYRKNLATAKQILDKEVNYTDTIFKITETLPRGTVLDTISLTPADIGGQTSLTVHAKDYNAVTALKSNFENSPNFSNAHFQSITDGTGSDTGGDSGSGASTNAAYPLTVNFSVKIEKNEAKS